MIEGIAQIGEKVMKQGQCQQVSLSYLCCFFGYTMIVKKVKEKTTMIDAKCRDLGSTWT